MLIERKIREIIEKYPLPSEDKDLQDVMERWMIYLAEEIVDGIKGEQKELATKSDLEKVIEFVNSRFEAMDKRFESLQREMDKRFEAMEKANAARFEAMDKRFEAMEKANATRFEAINSRFESLEKRLGFMQWLIGGGMVAMLLLISLKLFFPHIFPQ